MKQKAKNGHIKITDTYLPDKGIPKYEALKRIELELEEDGLMQYDLGSYTTIEMLPEANYIIHETLGKNLVNKYEYHRTTEIHENLVKTIADLLHAPDRESVLGSSVTGSSEAIFLAVLAAKWYWKKKQKEGQPNIVFCSNAHVCWFKFSRYLDVEIRVIELEKPHVFPIEKIGENIDQNTISVVAILGCTQLGTCDPIYDLNQLISEINLKNSWDVGIHVDAAIGGFLIPFLEEQKHLIWDFQLPLVRSINLSAHKYGLVYPGLGWIVFRDKNYFQPELRLSSDYLSGVTESFTINFSRSSSLVIAQYFNFLHYGLEGYQKMARKCLRNANLLSELLVETGIFKVVSKGILPLVVFAFKNKEPFNEEEFTGCLRRRKWMVPYYQLSGKLNKVVMRVVVRDDITEVLIRLLISDLLSCYKTLKEPYKTTL